MSWLDEVSEVVSDEEARAALGGVLPKDEPAPDAAPAEQPVAPVGATAATDMPVVDAAALPQDDDYWALFNRNLIEAVAAPFDIAVGAGREVRSGLGLEPSTARLPSEFVMDQIGKLGTRFGEEDMVPQTTLGKAAAGAGNAAGMLPAFGVGGTAMAGYQGPAQSFVNPVGQAIRTSFQTPGTAAATTALEMAAGAGAPIGGEAGADIFREQGWNEDLGRSLGEVAGGIGAPLAGATAAQAVGAGGALARHSPGLSIAKQLYQRARHPLDASFTRASNSIRGRVADPEAAAAMLDEAPTMPMTPGMQTGNPELLTFDRSVLRSDPALAEQFSTTEQQAMSDVRSYLSGLSEGATVNDARVAAGRVVETAKARIDQDIQASLNAADAAVARAMPQGGMDQETHSRTFMEALEGARVAARNVEREAWDAVPTDIKVTPTITKGAYHRIVETRGEEGARSIDPYFRQTIEGVWQKEPSRTVHNLNVFRSEALRSAREARARGDNLTASISEDLAEAARLDIDAVQVDNEALKAAREISRDYHARFTQGEVGKLLKYQRGGGRQIDPATALRRIVGSPSGERLTANMEAVDRAFTPFRQPDTPGPEQAGLEAVQDFILGDFQRNVRNADREFTPARAANWAIGRQGFLSRYPEIERLVTGAVDTTKTAAEAAGSRAVREKAVKEKASSVFLDSRIHREFDAIMGTNNPGQAVAEIITEIRTSDPTGRALLGLRQSATEYLLRKSTGHAASRGRVLRGDRLDGLLSDDRSREALEMLYTPDQMAVLDDYARGLRSYDMMHDSVTQSASPLVTPDIVDLAVDNLAKFVGVKAGGAVSQGGGSSLHIASQGRKIATTIVNRLNSSGAEALMRDAVNNPKLYQELLRGRRGEAKDGWSFDLPDAEAPNLAAWLMGASSDYFHGDKEEPQDAFEDALSTVGGVLTR